MKLILNEEDKEELHEVLSKIIAEKLESSSLGSTLENTYLNKRETCSYLKISNNTLYDWILQGLPVIRIGKTTRFKVIEINKWIKQFENTT
ncbi:helix-turn-helix transcriptional regulator [Helcococcus bovis]|uniref:helix-turn-helix transcriptional regulator n=1 Tax=Helcococcus bovis TaxID=3153252 RepID=UPI0038BD3363